MRFLLSFLLEINYLRIYGSWFLIFCAFASLMTSIYSLPPSVACDDGDDSEPHLSQFRASFIIDLGHLLLSITFTSRHRIYTRVAKIPVRTKLCSLLKENLDIFAWQPSDMTGVPRSIIEHRLNIREGYSPVRQKKIGQTPERAMALQAEVQKLVEAGIMRDVYYHDWLSNPVMVKKHDGSWWMCVDFTDLNKACPQDCYPLPEIDWKVESLCGYPFKYFLDAYKGYHQIQLAESDEEKTAFHTGQGVYCYSKMPFGLKNAGATYQRLVDKAFDSQIGWYIEVYVDDLVVKSHIEAEMLRDIGETFRTLRKINMKLSPKKCTFGAVEGMFLGCMVTPEGIKPCPDKTEAVLQLPSPPTIKEFRASFIIALGHLLLSITFASRHRIYTRVAKIYDCRLHKMQYLSAFIVVVTGKDLAQSNMQLKSIHQIGYDHKIHNYYNVYGGRNGQSPYYRASVGATNGGMIALAGASVVATAFHLYLNMAECGHGLEAKGLMRYFHAHPIVVITDQPIKQIMSRPDVAGRLQKWSVMLGEHNITCQPRTSMKGQVLEDFLAEMPDESQPDASVVETQQEPLTLFTNGSSCVDGSGAGLLLISPEGTEFTYVLRFQFAASKFEAEYEALITGLRITAQMGVRNVHVSVDSKLVANQVLGAYVAKEENTIKYLEKVKSLVLVEILKEKFIQEKEVTTVVEEDGPTWMTTIMEYLKEGTLPSDRKEARKLRIKA
uniref:Reverse transcriptase domain-containing protein n=1 Tax=Tanacetum cinerariifolium TaxID=118510 RepID=A0A6L2JZB8_TANCI|nr:reverse transcriptase domain-containing protein [Tanacetum cinerariifolium]